MEAVKHFLAPLLATLPANWPQWLGAATVLVLHFMMTRTKKVRANNFIEAVSNVVMRLPGVGKLIKATPIIGAVMGYLDTPDDPSTPPPTPPETRTAISIPLDGPKMMLPWLAFAALSLSACRLAPESILYKASSTTAIAASSCVSQLAAADESHQSVIRTMAHNGDKVGAQKALDEWLAKYGYVHAVCISAAATAVGARAAAPLVARGVGPGQKSVAGWVADLTAAAAKVVESLSAIGIKLEGGK